MFWALLLSSEHSGVPEDSKSPTFPSVGLQPHTWPKWGCDRRGLKVLRKNIFFYFQLGLFMHDGDVDKEKG
jgi:hypothetical protein